jgi:hypothetical protein
MTLSFQTTTVTRVPLHPLLLQLAIRAEFHPTPEMLADGYSDDHLRVSLSGCPAALRLLDRPRDEWRIATDGQSLTLEDVRRGRAYVFMPKPTC